MRCWVCAEELEVSTVSVRCSVCGESVLGDGLRPVQLGPVDVLMANRIRHAKDRVCGVLARRWESDRERGRPSSWFLGYVSRILDCESLDEIGEVLHEWRSAGRGSAAIVREVMAA